MATDRPILPPRPGYLAVLALAFLALYGLLDRVHLLAAREDTLRVADAAMAALADGVARLGPIGERDGELRAGGSPIGSGTAVHVLQSTGLDATVFHGDRAVATTVLAPLATLRAPEEVARTVLREGQVYRGEVNGRLARYQALRDADGRIVGMLATSRDRAAFVRGLLPFRGLLATSFLAVYGLVVVLWVVAHRTTRELTDQALAIEEKNARLEAAAALLRRRAAELEAARAEAEAARDEAQQANRSKSLFLANMSHELRTPLNAVIGYGELLLEEAPALEADLQRILGASRHLLAIISDILDLAKIEAGRLELDLHWLDLDVVLHDVATQAAPLVSANGNTLRTELGEGVARMRVDPTRLCQVLLNLLSNAAKFTEGGEIVLAVEPVSGDRLRFTVRDTGIGMDEAELAKVFEAFVQGDASHTRRYGGTGLGLTIVRLLVERMGGTCEVASRPGEGTTFTVLLPVEVRIRTTTTPPAQLRRANPVSTDLTS